MSKQAQQEKVGTQSIWPESKSLGFGQPVQGRLVLINFIILPCINENPKICYVQEDSFVQGVVHKK